jgi:hypothetical protein
MSCWLPVLHLQALYRTSSAGYCVENVAEDVADATPDLLRICYRAATRPPAPNPRAAAALMTVMTAHRDSKCPETRQNDGNDSNDSRNDLVDAPRCRATNDRNDGKS